MLSIRCSELKEKRLLKTEEDLVPQLRCVAPAPFLVVLLRLSAVPADFPPPPPTFRIPIQRRTLGAKDWTSISASRTCGNLVSAYYKCNWPLLKLWACHAEKQKGNQLLHQHQSARLRLLTLAPSAAARPEVWRPRGSGFPTTASPLPEGRWVCPAAFPFPMTLHS